MTTTAAVLDVTGRAAYLEALRNARLELLARLGEAGDPVDRAELETVVAREAGLSLTVVRAALWELIADRAVAITAEEGLICLP